jgi:hypothetical protein
LEFSNIAPDTDWKQFWGEWLTVGGEEQRDTLLAIMPFAIAGAGGGSLGHFEYGSHLARNRALLDAIGVPEAKIREIVRSTDIEKTDTLIKEAFAEGLEARTAEQKAAAIETLREQNRLITAAGLPRITKESEYTYTFTDPVTNESREFETEEEALAHWRDTALQQNEAALETIATAAREGSIDFLTDEGKVSNDTRVQETDVVMSFPRAVKEGIITREQLEARLQSFILQEGMSAADAVKATESLVIRARSYTEATRDGQLRYTVQLFKGADALNIFEDFAEDAMKRAIADGIADPLTILADLRDYQTATGDTILPAGYEYDPDNALPLIEAFSALARAQVIGNVSTDSIPRSVGQWLETITTYGEHTLATAKDIARGYAPDLQRTATLREAIGKGNLPPRLLDLINDSIGINEKETFRRMEKAYEEQLMAEAMGGFPEIQSELQGRIPHPQTLRDNQHPLAGEVRRIWEAMKKPTRRRDSKGRQIDRTNEANAYFLPIGEMTDLDKVREAMNEKGFDFQTPADLLDALDSSVSYNKLFYGTASRGNDSFAIGKATTETRPYPPRTDNIFSDLLGMIKTMSFDNEASRMVKNVIWRAINSMTENASQRASFKRQFSKTLMKSKGVEVFDRSELRHVLDEVFAYDADALKDAWEIESAAASRGNDSFAVGRATVTPTASTQTFPTKDGGVIGPASFAIGAYHGTPHKVDKFTTDKIGTGEGAQAYGWGLYFAQDESVARWYRDNLGNAQMKWNLSQGRSGLWVIWDLRDPSDPEPYQSFDSKEEAETKLAELQPNKPQPNLYSVTLKVEEDELLDWDKPLSEQSAKVRAVIQSLAIPEVASNGGRLLGQGAYELLYSRSSSSMTVEMYREASEALAAAGIKGIRYLDGNSRTDGQGSYNYVIFNDADIEITEENGQPVNLASSQAILDSSFSIGRASDAEYLQLAKDPEKNAEQLRAMVDEAANSKGYNIRAMHGTAEKFDSFDPKKGGKMTKALSAKSAIFLTDDLPTAKSYAVYAAEDGPVMQAMEEADKAERKGDWDGYDEAIRQAEELDTYEGRMKRRDNMRILDAYIAGDYI